MRRLAVKTADGTVNLSMRDITAVEYYDHRLIYHLYGNRKFEGLYQKQPFEKQAETCLKSGVFVKISASYFVNMENIKRVTSGGFIMTDGTEYKITRKYSEAKKIYIDFALKNNNGGVLE